MSAIARAVLAVFAFVLVFPAHPLYAQLPSFDFTKASVVAEWKADHGISSITSTAEGMRIVISGEDPYLHGPVRNYPADSPLIATMRMKCDQPGFTEIFWYKQGSHPVAGDESGSYVTQAGVWEDVRIVLPALGSNTILRIDPPGSGGVCVIQSLTFQAMNLQPPAAWLPPTKAYAGDGALVLVNGQTRLEHSATVFGRYDVIRNGVRIGYGHDQPMLGYVRDSGASDWIDIKAHAAVTVSGGSTIRERATLVDADGRTWTLDTVIQPGPLPDTFQIDSRVAVSRDVSLIYLPLVTLFGGAEAFGAARNQGLFAGLEYMDAPDTSSSAADITTAEKNRQLPDTLKITFPLMSVQGLGRYVGLIWDMSNATCALFDSPDRFFQSGSHVMGVVMPGSDGIIRDTSSLTPRVPSTLTAENPHSTRAWIIAGDGASVVPSIEQYVALRGLPALPSTLNQAEYVSATANSWLYSKIREGSKYRHAYWPGTSFDPLNVADPAIYMEWLASMTGNPTLAATLRTAGAAAKANVNWWDWNYANVSHNAYPIGMLLWGQTAAIANNAGPRCDSYLGAFDEQGRIIYKPQQGGIDYGATHFAPDANGLTASYMKPALELASVSGDQTRIDAALNRLYQFSQYDNTVPRGAQTWEVPLHTPDILASRWNAQCYLMGYKMTNDPALLQRAVYWAWTGIPFVYLINPAARVIGTYATIPVFGATGYNLVNWMGLPVQWCGMVYADALYRLADFDNSAPWKMLADGITVSGIQQNEPDNGNADLRGLLPDSFNLRAQVRNPVFINPGTIQECATVLYTGNFLYDMKTAHPCGYIIHAPGRVQITEQTETRAAFTVTNWYGGAYYLLINRVPSTPRVWVNGQQVALTGANSYTAAQKRLVLQVIGDAHVVVDTGYALSGQMDLKDYVGSPAQFSLHLRLTRAGAAPVERHIPLNGAGGFEAKGIPGGQYTARFRVEHWLAVSAPVDLTADLQGITASLVNGDADGDNQITLFDYLVLDAQFGLSDQMADLDGDGAVTLFDYLIIDRSFGAVGSN